MEFRLDEVEGYVYALVDDLIREANRNGPNLLLIIGKLQMYIELRNELIGVG